MYTPAIASDKCEHRNRDDSELVRGHKLGDSHAPVIPERSWVVARCSVPQSMSGRSRPWSENSGPEVARESRREQS